MAAKGKGLRHAARVRAFQILYGLAFSPADDASRLRRVFNESPAGPAGEGDVAGAEQNGEKVKEFAWELVHGVWSKLDDLDQVVSRFSQHWKVGRIGKIELTILRLAVFEMLHRPDIPLRVTINEAVELAKSFGDESSGNFVNGILDAAAKAVDSGEFGGGKAI